MLLLSTSSSSGGGEHPAVPESRTGGNNVEISGSSQTEIHPSGDGGGEKEAGSE